MTDAAALTLRIETRHHARHREHFPVLAAMAERVEAVHFGDEGVPEFPSGLLRQRIGEMEVHVRPASDFLFPQSETTDA